MAEAEFFSFRAGCRNTLRADPKNAAERGDPVRSDFHHKCRKQTRISPPTVTSGAGHSLTASGKKGYVPFST